MAQSSKPTRTRARVCTIRYGTGPSPLGPILIGVSERGVCSLFLLLEQDEAHALNRVRQHFPGAELISDATAAAPYFPRVAAFLSGDDDCRDLPLDLSSGTPFQQQVWERLRRIPRGATRTYGEIAEDVGRPRAARAVGTACGINPVSLLVPCHRVVASGGALGGYGWGPERKQALLDLEQV